MQSAAKTAAATIERWIAQAATNGVRDNYTSKRRELRTSWDGSLMVQFADEPGRSPVFVRALDLSRVGIGFHSRQKVEIGTRLRLSADDPDEFVAVTVTHCSCIINGFHVGAEFDV